MATIYAIFFFFIFSLSQEPASGIYIINTPPKKTPCENELKMLIGQSKVCLSKKPIINIEELKDVTDIHYNPTAQMHYIDIEFSSAGIETLNKTIHSLPGTKFALVIHGDVICIVAIEEEIEIQSIRIGGDVELKDLLLIHDALKKVKY